MASPAGAAMYPALARAEQAKAEQTQRRGTGGKPSWANSTHPMWDVEPPRPAPGYAIVPGLVSIRKR
jgi:hypothetical protein